MNILGFDIGGTKVAVCLGTDDGKLLGSERIDNRDRAPEDTIADMIQAGKNLIEKAGLKTSDIAAAGIGAPAPMDIPNGLILCPSNMKLWKRVPVRDMIADAFGVATFFDNDANAGALAEWIFGAGQGVNDMLYVTLSTGIGGGIIANGHLLHGTSFLAGEIGHIVLDLDGPPCNCGMTGCYEAFCGGRAIAQRMKKELADKPGHRVIELAGGSLDNVDMVSLEAAVREGDDYAVALWDEMCLRNAQAIGMFLNIFNPEKIVLGTIAWAAGDLFMEPVKKYVGRYAWKETESACTLTVSSLGREIGEYSGICVALNALYEKGEWKLPWL